MSVQDGYKEDAGKYERQTIRFHHSVVKANGSFLSGEAYDAVIDAVMKDQTICEVSGYTIHIISHSVDESGNKVTKVKVDGIDG